MTHSVVTPDMEALVLNWMLDDSEVAKAVDLAIAGSEAAARPMLVQATRQLQRKCGQAPAFAVASPATPPSPVSIASGPPPAKKRRAADSSPTQPAAQPLGEAAGTSASSTEAARWQPHRQHWKLSVPEVLEMVNKNILPRNFTAVKSPEVFLLQPGALPDDARDACQLGIAVDTYVAMRDAMEAMRGDEFEVTLTEMIVAEEFVCARVALPPVVPCHHKVPHIILGIKAGAKVRRGHVVKLLKELKAGSKKRVTVIPMAKSRTMKGRLEGPKDIVEE